MKIGIPALGSDLESAVASRLGECSFLLIVDSESLSFEALPCPPRTGKPGSGIQIVTLALGKEAQTILTGFVSPGIAKQLRENDIDVVVGVSGTVREAVEKYGRDQEGSKTGEGTPVSLGAGGRAFSAAAKAARQFAVVLPVLGGVVLLIGLFKTVISEKHLASIFGGNPLADALGGSLFGSLLAGNPVNSYVAGKALLDNGVSLYAVTAFIVTWASVGVVQLPAEISVLGWKFAVPRIVAAFVLAQPIALLCVLISKGMP
jgi:predicted Fe-Mo cluster-binding NifX family protein